MPNRRRRNILVVDDMLTLRETIKEILSSKGYEVLEASSGEEALEKIEYFPLDVLLTDCEMRGMNGIELARRVKALKPDVKIIIMSGRKRYRSKAAKLGTECSFLEKPFSINELEESINS